MELRKVSEGHRTIAEHHDHCGEVAIVSRGSEQSRSQSKVLEENMAIRDEKRLQCSLAGVIEITSIQGMSKQRKFADEAKAADKQNMKLCCKRPTHCDW